jgi:hypothetical protein
VEAFHYQHRGKENANGAHDVMIHAFGSYAMPQRLPNANVTLGWGFGTPQAFFLLYSPKCLEAAYSEDHLRDSRVGSFEAHLSLTAIAQEGAEDQPWRFSILRLVPRSCAAPSRGCYELKRASC